MPMNTTLAYAMGMALLGLALVTTAGAASAQQKSLQQLLDRVREAKQEQAERNRERVAEFVDKVDQREALLSEAKSELADAQERQKRLQNEFSANEKQLGELQAKLEQRAGDFGEVFGVVRQVAGDVRSTLNSSLTSVEMPDRTKFLNQLAESKALPSLDKVKRLWTTMLGEMVASGQISQFQHKYVTPDGTTKTGEIVRVGTFNASVGQRFLKHNSETGQLSVLPRQPAGRWQSFAANLGQAETGANETVSGVADPSQGAILSLLIQKPNLWERIQQGKLVGYIVIAVGLIGLLLALERLFSLTRTERSMRRQRKDPDNPGNNNPLGRVLNAYHDNRDTDVETLQLKLDQAILRDVPGLERRLSTIRVLSAVAPLLGLLGTVIGMIATFQAITLFGTGDPKLMADGISQALVTTVLGLIVSVPLVLLHSMLNGRSRRLIQMLEQQSSGLVATHAEAARAT